MRFTTAQHDRLAALLALNTMGNMNEHTALTFNGGASLTANNTYDRTAKDANTRKRRRGRSVEELWADQEAYQANMEAILLTPADGASTTNTPDNSDDDDDIYITSPKGGSYNATLRRLRNSFHTNRDRREKKEWRDKKRMA